MKKKYLFLIFAIYSFSMFGQMCGTPEPQPNLPSQQRMTLFEPQFLDIHYDICIDVFYHIVRETDETGGFDPNEISNSIVLLNQVYNSHNISLNNAGFDYIDDSYFYNIDDIYPSTTEFDSLIQINNHANAINVYIVNNFIGISV